MNQFAFSLEARKTPPDLKWLLNERAAIAGAVQKVAAQCRYLDKELAKAESKYQAAVKRHERTAQSLKQNLAEKQTVLQALDNTIRMAYENIRCDAGGVVSAWAGRYGERGALARFVLEALIRAAPESLSVRNVMDSCVFWFGLKLPTPADRVSLKSSVSGTLYALQKRGVAQKVTAKGPGYPSYWRAVNKFGAADLRKQAAMAMEVASHDVPNPT